MENEVNMELDRIIRSMSDADITLDFFRSLGQRLSIESTENM